ncbi:HD domain-containing protein [Magnetococcus sp. PR-3]|uniref:HD domain-containing protein n=1 Tax=Magnetococcus sp. PR-3 TaxID=3120355 RepID=UPI002FCE480D
MADLESMPVKLFRDPVHDMIELRLHTGPMGESPPWAWGDPLLLDLIDTPELQRLRRIRQLGPAAKVYPSAEHTRFSHALGAMHLASRMIAGVAQRHPGVITPLLGLQIRCAALIHDLGHGPYSHVFEHVNPHPVHHEQRGITLLKHDSGVRRAIYHFCEQHYLDRDRFTQELAIILGQGEATGLLGLARQFISSQLDADRMDYLQRDAHFTGVRYGRFDAAWLLRSLRLKKTESGPVLCVEIAKGPAALESYIAARDDMYRQVYDHKAVRAFEALLIHIIRTLHAMLDAEQPLPSGTPIELIAYLKQERNPHHEDYTLFHALDDAVLDYAMGYWSRLPLNTEPSPLIRELQRKSQMFQQRETPYKRLLWHLDPENSLWSEGEDALNGQDGATDVIIDADAAESLHHFLKEHRDYPITISQPDNKEKWNVPLALLVHVDSIHRAPYAHMQYAIGSRGSIPVLDGSGYLRPAEQASERINFLGHCRRKQARVFVDRRALNAVMLLIRQKFQHPLLKLWEN